jgi:signal transduction histidine kinase/streptogramin lyase
VGALELASNGAVWVGMTRRGPGLGLQQIKQGVFKPFAASGFDGAGTAVGTLFRDREKHLWVGTQDDGVIRVNEGQIDRFRAADGLSGDVINAVYQDREDTIWVATSEGLDSFRKTAMISFTVHDGLTANVSSSVLADREGTIWIGNLGGLDSISGGRVSSLRKSQGLPGGQVTALLEDHGGRLWLGVDNRLSVFEHGAFRLINRRDGAPLGTIRAMAEDRENNVWAIALGSPQRLIRITNLGIREDIPVPPVLDPSALAADPENGIWLGLFSGHLARYRGGQFETLQFTAGTQVRQVIVGPDGSVLGATNRGVIAWRNGTLRTMTARNGLPCDRVYGGVFDANGALWLYAECALVRIAASDLKRWWERADTIVGGRVFDALDGVRSGPAAFEPKASRSRDGTLWFASSTVVQTIDPAHLPENTLPPPVHIEQVIADRRAYPATSAVRLPPLTRDLEIDFVGLSYIAPQRVGFRYRLEGRDNSWQESGSRRQAFYNDLRPGKYRFRVIARNNDGVWNDQGAAIDVVIAPAWYQTNWFVALCVVGGLVAAWVFYQLRMTQVARQLNARFDERLEERTRMARDLHDTLLQTVQASKLVADDALDCPDDLTAMRRSLEQLSEWLSQATREARTAVNSLRASTTEQNDLAGAFGRAIDDCRRQRSIEPSLTVTGEPREMHPVVRDEVYRIGYEAIRNACMHSRGSRLEVALNYGHELTVRVADNGVGIDSAVADSGKEGHFGLQGMRERAVRIGATLKVSSTASGGTEIVLIVPGRAIFSKQSTSTKI